MIKIKTRITAFVPLQEHATEPFQGTRISFIAFTHGLYNKLTPYVANQLGDLGFNAARTDGKDLPFFEAFRIEKSYLTDDHNAAFKAFREARKAEDMPPPAHPAPPRSSATNPPSMMSSSTS